MTYQDRTEAGQALAAELERYAGRADTIVLALPRGGVPVGYEIACALRLPLDVLVVRKLGVPWQRELAMGAIASGGVRVINDDVVQSYGIGDAEIDQAVAAARRELERRELAYRGGRPAPDVNGRTVLLVDDGIATGATALAAVRALRLLGAARVVLATPVAPASSLAELSPEVDEVVCPLTPPLFFAIGEYYDDFSQVDDETVRALLDRSAAASSAKTSNS